jgi:hypothetical protein
LEVTPFLISRRIAAGPEKQLVATIGELSDFSLADLTMVISQRKRTGRLVIKAGGNDVAMYFEAGQLVRITSSDIALRLGRMLVRQNLLDTPRLLEALHMQVESGADTPIGEVLLKKGWITESDLRRCLEEQSIEVLSKAMSSGPGMFTFDAGVTIGRAAEVPPLEPMQLLKIAEERTAAIAVLQERLPSHLTPIFMNVPPSALGEIQMSVDPAEAIVLGILRSGPRTYPELGAQSALDELSLGAAVLTLLELEYVTTASSYTAGSRPLVAARTN